MSAVFIRRSASGGKFAGTNKPRKYPRDNHASTPCLAAALCSRHSSTCQRIDCASVCRGENLMSTALLYVWFTCSPILASRSMVRSQREKKARCASLRWPTCPQPSHPTDHKTQKMVWAQHGIIVVQCCSSTALSECYLSAGNTRGKTNMPIGVPENTPCSYAYSLRDILNPLRNYLNPRTLCTATTTTHRKSANSSSLNLGEGGGWTAQHTA